MNVPMDADTLPISPDLSASTTRRQTAPPIGSALIAESSGNVSDLVNRLRQMMTPEGMQSPIGVEAADKIVRLRADNASLRADNDSLMRMVGEEGRANRMTMLFESQQAVLDAIASLHTPRPHDPNWCHPCDDEWPCATYLLIHPKEYK